jgi:hypothetical protein
MNSSSVSPLCCPRPISVFRYLRRPVTVPACSCATAGHTSHRHRQRRPTPSNNAQNLLVRPFIPELLGRHFTARLLFPANCNRGSTDSLPLLPFLDVDVRQSTFRLPRIVSPCACTVAGFEPSQHMVPLRSNNIRMNQNRPKQNPKQFSKSRSPSSLLRPLLVPHFYQGTRTSEGCSTHKHPCPPHRTAERANARVKPHRRRRICLDPVLQRCASVLSLAPYRNRNTAIGVPSLRARVMISHLHLLHTPCAPTHPSATDTS